jgi:hypothetical protein
MSQDKEARDLQIKDLEHRVMPAILLKQFHITYAPVPSGRTVDGQPVFKTDDKPMLQPVAVELFAMCSPADGQSLTDNRVGVVLLNVLNKPLESTYVVIEEVDLDNWGWGGLPTARYRQQRAAAGKS